MRTRRHTRRIGSLLLLLFAAGVWSTMAAEAIVRLQRKGERGFTKYILPSRVAGIGIEDLSRFKPRKPKDDPLAVKFDPTYEGGGFENKLKGDITVAGMPIPLFLDYAKHTETGKRRGRLFYGPGGWKLTKHWANEVKTWEEGVNIDRKATKALPGFVSKPHKPEKKYLTPPDGDSLTLNQGVGFGVRTLKQFQAEIAHAPYPQGLGRTPHHFRYWDSVLAPATGFLKMVPDPKWVVAGAQADAKPYWVTFGAPDDEGWLTGYVRSCTALVGEWNYNGQTHEIAIFDDDLDGRFGEVGADSIVIDGIPSLMGKVVSIGKPVAQPFRVTLEQGRGLLKLSPYTGKKGFLRLKWTVSEPNTQLLMAIVKSESNYFSLVVPSAKQKGRETHYNPILVPSGEYQIVGGLVRQYTRGQDHPIYCSFTGGPSFELAEDARRWVELGEPLSFPVELSIDDQNRLFTMKHPRGSAGEIYRWFSPRPAEARMVLKGLGESFLGEGKRSLMRLHDKDGNLMQGTIKYNDVQFNPDNGPFELTVTEIDPLVFKPREVTHTYTRIDQVPESEGAE